MTGPSTPPGTQTVAGLEPGDRVLVTGAGGQIGAAVAAELLAQGYAVTAFDRDWTRHPSTADRVVTGDVTDVDDVAAAIADCRGIAHLAAIPGLGGDDPYPLFRLNVSATFNVLQTAAERGIRRAAIASSIQATGLPNGHHDVRPSRYPMDEDTQPDVADAYSLSKQVDEQTAAAFARSHDLVVVAFRFPYTTTGDQLADAARHAADHPEGGVREGWSYLDVRDAGRAVRLALTTPLAPAAYVLGLAAPDNLPGRPAGELVRRFAPDAEVRLDAAELAAPTTLYRWARAAELLGWRAEHPVARARAESAEDERG